jgi:hypothetical protein
MAFTNLDSLALSGSQTVAGSSTVTGTQTVGGLVNTGTDRVSVTTGITAFATGGQTSATQLTTTINRVDTVATAADSVKLPLGVAGLVVYLTNNTATSMQVFGAGTDVINIGAGNVATATGVAQAANKSAVYFCTSAAPAAVWERVLTA